MRLGIFNYNVIENRFLSFIITIISFLVTVNFESK